MPCNGYGSQQVGCPDSNPCEDGFHKFSHQARFADRVVFDTTDVTGQLSGLMANLAAEELQNRIANLSEADLDRLEAFRCSKLAKASTRKVWEAVTGSKATDQTLIVLSGIAKVFVGDLIEAAVEAAAEEGQSPPLQAVHVAKGFQTLQRRPERPPESVIRKRMRL